MALVHVIDIATGEVVAAYPVPPVTNIQIQAGQEILFVDIPYGNPAAPNVIVEVIGDQDVQVTTEDGTVLIEGLFALLEDGAQVRMAFSDTGQTYGDGQQALTVPEFASLDAFAPTAAGGTDGSGDVPSGTGGRGNAGDISLGDLFLPHVRASGVDGEIPRPEFDLPVDIETDFLGQEPEQILLTPSMNMVWEKGLNGGEECSGGDGEGDGEGGHNVEAFPTHGSYMALAVSNGGVNDNVLEAFFGLPGGTLDGLGNGNATNGSGFKTTINVNIGDVVSFNWNFDADDYNPYNDFSFVVIDGVIFELMDTFTVGDYNATGWQTYTFVATSNGPIELGFGVSNEQDTAVQANLLVDNLQINGVPVANGSFESGDFTGWMTTGNTSIVTSHDEGGTCGTPVEFLFVVDGNDDNNNNEILKIALDGSSAAVAVSSAEIAAAIGTSDYTLGESGVQVDSLGNIFFSTDEGVENNDEFVVVKLANGTLQVIADTASVEAATGENGFDPEDLVLAPDGSIYVLDETNGGRILQITDPLGTPSINVLTTAADIVADVNGIDAIDPDFGIAISPDGSTVYFPSGQNGTPQGIIAVDTTTGDATVFNTNDPGFVDLDEFITTAPNGDLIVADEGADIIYRVDANTGNVTVFLSNAQIQAANGGVAPDLEGGFAFDSAGRFYLAEENEDNILVWQPVNPAQGTIDPNSGAILMTEAQIQASAGLTFLSDFDGGMTTGTMLVSGGSGDPGTMPLTDLEFAFGTLDTGGGVITNITHPDGTTQDNGDFFVVQGTFPGGEGIDWILTVNKNTGDYEFELLDNTVQHDGINLIGEDDQVFLTFSYGVNIGGQSASSTLTIGVKDDGPLISLKDGENGQNMLFEDGLVNVQKQEAFFPTASQGINFNFGADGPNDTGMGFTIELKSVSDGDGEGGPLPDGLKTSETDLPVNTFYDEASKTLIGYTGEDPFNEDAWVFTVELTDFMDGPPGPGMAEAVFTLYQAIEHPDINETGADDPIDLLFTITATDGDLDTASVDVLFIVKDDGPNVIIDTGAPLDMLVLDETRPEGTETDGNSNPAGLMTVMADFSDNFLVAPDFGADGPGSDTYALSLSAQGIGSGLYALDPSDTDDGDGDGIGQGAEILLTQSGNTITGSVGETDYFTISINPDTGVVTFTQLENIWHADTGNDDDSQALTTETPDMVQLIYSVTDSDGDTESAALDLGGGNVFKIEDDGPNSSVADGEAGIPDMLVLDETRPEGTETDGNSNPAGLMSISANFADNFSAPIDYGTDGPGSVEYSLSLSGPNVGSGLYALDPSDTDDGDGDGIGQGDEIVMNQVGDVITGSANGTDYFTIEINPVTGEVTFTQLNNIWHEEIDDDDDREALTTEVPSDLQVVQTVTDADGDSDSSSINLGGGNVFKIEDDGPTAVNDITAAEPGAPGTTNFVIMFDRSGSMDDDPNVDGFSERIDLARAAVASLLAAAASGGAINVLIIDFASDASSSGWLTGSDVLDQANAYLSSLLPDGLTNYEAATALTETEYLNGTPAADSSVIYFLSDGEPTTRTDDGTNDGLPNVGDPQGLTDAEVVAWEAFVDANIDEAYAVGVGTGTDTAELAEIAHPNAPIEVTDESLLIETLLGTLNAVASGNVLTDGVDDDFGTDGPGGIVSFTHDGVTYFSDGTTAGGVAAGVFALGVWTITTSGGGEFMFNTNTGDYDYEGSLNGGGGTEDFTYTIVDADGDQDTASLTITLPDMPDAEGLPLIVDDTPDDGDTLNGTDVAEILGGDDGNDTMNGGGGNDLLFGGAGVDSMNGGAGDDFIVSGPGDDLIFSSLGSDNINLGPNGSSSENTVFYTDILHAGDVIHNFDGIGPFRDVIDLDQLFDALEASLGPLDETARFDRVQVTDNGDQELLHINADNNPDFEVLLVTVNMTSGDLTEGTDIIVI